MTKKLVKTKVDTLSNFGELDSLINELHNIFAHATGKLTYEVDTYEEYGVRYTDFDIYEERLETDEQYAKRLASEKLYAETQAKREKAEFERLKTKFGG
jgi:hypothetical protein